MKTNSDQVFPYIETGGIIFTCECVKEFTMNAHHRKRSTYIVGKAKNLTIRSSRKCRYLFVYRRYQSMRILL